MKVISQLFQVVGLGLVSGVPFIWAGAALPAPLTRIADTRVLSREDADRGFPVLLRGVVTWRKGTSEITLQDNSGGTWGQIRVARRRGIWSGDDNVLTQLREGMEIEMEGITNAGGFAPVILPRSIRVMGPGVLPVARPFERGRFLAGTESAQRMEVRGLVLDYEANDGGWKLIVQVDTDKIWVTVTIDVLAHPRLILDKTVTIRGVGATAFNTRGEVLNAGLRVSIPGDVTVESQDQNLTPSVPVVPLGLLRAFRPETEIPRRVQVRGVATFVLPGQFLLLQDGNAVVRVEGHNLSAITPSDLVQAVGYVDMSLYAGMLSGAAVVKVGSAQLPEPLLINPAQVLAINTEAANTGQRAQPHDFNGHLIRFTARLLAVEPRQQKEILSRKLSLQHDSIIVEAVLHHPGVAVLDAFEVGSQLEVTGIAQLEYARGEGLRAPLRPLRVGILVRSPADLRVTATPPWWTARRILAAVGVSVVALAATLIWVWFLQRQIRRKTQLLTEEMRARRNAAIEFRATLRERTRLAANLHDTLLQSLSGIGFQIDACTPEVAARAEDAAHLRLARQMVTHSTREVRDAVWALRSLSFDGKGLRETLVALVERMAARHQAVIDFQAEGEFSQVSDFVAGNLVFAVQEALHNALKHGAPRRISVLVEANAEKALITVTVSDDGRGFDVASAAAVTEGHFGLTGIRERMKTLGGNLRIESEPGHGTTLVLQVPVRPYDAELA